MSFYYKRQRTSEHFAAAAKPLMIAPSTFGLTQKSPHTASLFFASQRHFSFSATLIAGNALPLTNSQAIVMIDMT